MCRETHIRSQLMEFYDKTSTHKHTHLLYTYTLSQPILLDAVASLCAVGTEDSLAKLESVGRKKKQKTVRARR